MLALEVALELGEAEVAGPPLGRASVPLPAWLESLGGLPPPLPSFPGSSSWPGGPLASGLASGGPWWPEDGKRGPVGHL